MAQSLGLLGEDGEKITHGYIRKSVFYSNVDSDRCRFDRSARHESGKRLLRFQLDYRFGSGWMKLKRPPTEAALLFLSGPLFHDLDVSVNLIGNHDPAAREICQDRGFGFVLRQGQQTTAFFGLHPAMFCAVHCYFFCVTPPRIHWNLDSVGIAVGKRDHF